MINGSLLLIFTRPTGIPGIAFLRLLLTFAVKYYCHMRLLIFGLGGPEIMLIVILALLLFGGKKIPELMNGIGKGVKSFRDGMDGKSDEGGGKAEPDKKNGDSQQSGGADGKGAQA